jgi:hypothetical protein
MIKSRLLATAFAVAALSFSAQANTVPEGMEVCKVGAKHTEVMVPKGQCAEIAKGNLAGLSEEVKAEVEAASK